MNSRASILTVSASLILSLPMFAHGQPRTREPVDSKPIGAFIAKSRSSLPICGKNNENAPAYAEDDARFFVCDGRAWDEIYKGSAVTGAVPGTIIALEGKSGTKTLGVLRITQVMADKGNAVKVDGIVTGLPANSSHSVYFYERGNCAAKDAASVGGIYAPKAPVQQNTTEKGVNQSEVGIITADARGIAKVDMQAPQFTLGQSGFNIVDKALVVHASTAKAPNNKDLSAGPKIACGVISMDTSNERPAIQR